MKVLDLIHQKASRLGLEFLLIGGHAINVIGDRRQTRDIDLAICAPHKEQWKKLILDMDYEVLNDTNAFLQFAPTELGNWPIDIIIIDEQTFDGLRSGAVATKIDSDTEIFIPSARHLIAMKLHTLQQGDAVRKLRDLLDIVTLIRHDNIDIEAGEFQKLCEKYASEDVYGEILELCDDK